MSAGFERILGKRALLSALGSLAGVRAEGRVLVTAPGSDIVLPAFTYAVPVINGAAIYSRMVKTFADTTVTAAGVGVRARAVCGGPSGNLPLGTKMILQPCPVGVTAIGEVSQAFEGGVASTGPGSCARVVAYDALGREEARRGVWEAQGEGFPAIVIARMGSNPEGLATTRASRREHHFKIMVFSAHYSGNDERSEEGEHLLDEIEKRLEGLEDFEGEEFSGPGVELGVEAREQGGPNAHVWSIDCVIHYSLPAVDLRLTDGVSWQPWETTRLQIAAPEEGAQDAKTVVDVTVEHEQ